MTDDTLREVVERVFNEPILDQARRVGVHGKEIDAPGAWMLRVRKAALLAAINQSTHAPSEDAEMVEVDVEDAPIELSLEEAYAWVSGYNAAIRAMQKEAGK